jgi:hypothetical protein
MPEKSSDEGETKADTVVEMKRRVRKRNFSLTKKGESWKSLIAFGMTYNEYAQKRRLANPIRLKLTPSKLNARNSFPAAWKRVNTVMNRK